MSDTSVKISSNYDEILKRIKATTGKPKKFAIEEAIREKYPEYFKKGE